MRELVTIPREDFESDIPTPIEIEPPEPHVNMAVMGRAFMVISCDYSASNLKSLPIEEA